MEEIFVTKRFNFARDGHTVIEVPEGKQSVSKRCAKVAFRNGWARKQAQMPANKAVQPPQNKEYPKHKGGGYYELSNGDTVRGKEEANKQQRSL